jgi:hypothetical protein
MTHAPAVHDGIFPLHGSMKHVIIEPSHFGAASPGESGMHLHGSVLQ